jgi:hypothetical protein
MSAQLQEAEQAKLYCPDGCYKDISNAIAFWSNGGWFLGETGIIKSRDVLKNDYGLFVTFPDGSVLQMPHWKEN